MLPLTLALPNHPTFSSTPRSKIWPWQAGVRAFHLARLWSVLLSTATVAAIYGLARSALPTRPGVALLATGLAATLPEFAFIGGAINNDNAAALFGTLALWGGFAIYQAQGNWRAGWWTPLALGIGLLSKVSTLSLWPIVALWICAWQRTRTKRQGHAVANGLASFAAPMAALGFEWGDHLSTCHPHRRTLAIAQLAALWRPQRHGACATDDRPAHDTSWTWADTMWLLQGWFLSFWGKFGAVGQFPYPAWIYALLGTSRWRE